MKVLLKKDWKYTFFINDVGTYILTVICGMIGIYEIEHKLTPEEVEKYKTEGESFIDALASDISFSPSKYL